MRVALISDIHGNLQALESVMEDIHRRNVDKIICLGDIIGKGANTLETVDICRKHCDVIVKGNWEYNLYELYKGDSHGMPQGVINRSLWFIEDAGTDIMEYIGGLPFSHEMYISGKLIRLFHAHPLNFNRYYSNSPKEQLLELFQKGIGCTVESLSDVAVYGDIHTSYMQMIDGRMLLNTGSVGNPLDVTQASYVIIEGEDGLNTDSSLNIQFIRVNYDINKAVMCAREKNVPDLDGYIQELTQAKYFRRM